MILLSVSFYGLFMPLTTCVIRQMLQERRAFNPQVFMTWHGARCRHSAGHLYSNLKLLLAEALKGAFIVDAAVRCVASLCFSECPHRVSVHPPLQPTKSSTGILKCSPGSSAADSISPATSPRLILSQHCRSHTSLFMHEYTSSILNHMFNVYCPHRLNPGGWDGNLIALMMMTRSCLSLLLRQISPPPHAGFLMFAARVFKKRNIYRAAFI